LTIPDCLTFEDNKNLEIFDQSATEENDQFIGYTQYSQYDYVFQVHEGINFLTLMNLVNPTEACLWSSERLSFEYRTYEDDQLVYAIE
jgi:hypothetical protein